MRERTGQRRVRKVKKIGEIIDKMVVVVIRCDEMENEETKNDGVQTVVWSKTVRIAESYGSVH